MLDKINSFLKVVPKYENKSKGKGVVICAGCRHFLSASININLLEKYDIEIEWYYVGDELLNFQKDYLKNKKNIKLINCLDIIPKWYPEKITEYNLKGFMIKPFALMMSNFNEIILLDADNIPLINPLNLFESDDYNKYGNIFWKDVKFDNENINNNIYKKSSDIFNKYKIKSPQENNFDWAESGQIIINQEKCWKALCLSYYFNYNHDYYYKIFFGDKDLYYLGFQLTNIPYYQHQYYPHGLSDDKVVFSKINMLIQRNPIDGSNCFLHRTLSKITNKTCNNLNYIYKNLDYPLKSKLINGQININANLNNNKICFVTAFFDIGRDNFEFNSRKKIEYFKYFENLIKMNNINLVVFIEENDYDLTKNICSNSLSNIIIKIVNRNEIKSWNYNNRIKQILLSDNFKKLIVDRNKNDIETTNADYLTINNCKTDFIKLVIDNKLIDCEFYAWIDFGLIRNLKYLPESLYFNLKNIDKNLIHFMSHDYWNEKIQKSEIDLIKDGSVYIMGGFFIGEKKNLLRLNELFHNTLNDYLNNNIIDDDQSIYYIINQKYNILKLHKREDIIEKYDLKFLEGNIIKPNRLVNQFKKDNLWLDSLNYFNEDNTNLFKISKELEELEKSFQKEWQNIKLFYEKNKKDVIQHHVINLIKNIKIKYYDYEIINLNKFIMELSELNIYINDDIFYLNCCLIYFYKTEKHNDMFNIINKIFNLKIYNDETINIIIYIVIKNFNQKLFLDIYNVLDDKYKIFYLSRLYYYLKINDATLDNLLLKSKDKFLINIGEIYSNNKILSKEVIESCNFTFEYPIYLNKFYYLSFKDLNNKNTRQNLSLLHRKLYPCINYKRKTSVEKTDKIKIGFISNNFRNHSVARDRTGVIKNLSKDIFDIHIIYFNIYKDDIYFANLWNSGCKNILLTGNFDNYIKQIEDLNLNILIYCDIGMQEETFMLAHCRLAPIQLTTWGHSETSGIDTIDYYISSSLYENVDCYNHYSEKLILHKSLCTFYYDKYYDISYKLRDKNFKLDLNNTKYLLYSQYLHKISEHDFNLFIDIFNKISNIKIVFINGTNIKDNIIKINNKLNNYKNRYIITNSLQTGNFYQVIKDSFLLLDSYPHGGCNTSLEAFYFNKIILTKPSQFLRGRFTLGFYKKMGMSDCIMNNNNDFVELIKKFLESNIYKESIESKINKNKYLLYNDFESVYEWSNTLENLFKSN